MMTLTTQDIITSPLLDYVPLSPFWYSVLTTFKLPVFLLFLREAIVLQTVQQQ